MPCPTGACFRYSEVNDDYHHYRHEVLRLRLLGQEKLPLCHACHYLDSQIDVGLTNVYVGKSLQSNDAFSWKDQRIISL